ncbi:MAG TPA: type II CAAX endopeptidase family protein [Chitinophagales bacterium]|nr:type II CAAX endopeptidase family protein [Chitinophagales bacterium]HNM32105.1 type II CAAX endopeptidase family protein [Chitinophagales bacterium]
MTDNLKRGISEATPKGMERYSLGLQWLIWLGVFMSCFFVAQLVSSGIILAYYKSVDIKIIAKDSAHLNVLRYAQMLASILGFLLPAIIFSKLKDNNANSYTHADKGFPALLLGLIPLMIFTIYPVIDISFFINKWMPWSSWYASFQEEYKSIVNGLMDSPKYSILLLNIITIALIPAISEEWLFRGTLQRLLVEKFNVHTAVFLSSCLFSFIHFEFSGFLPRIVLGMFLGYLYYYSGSLWASIYAHVLNNGSQIVFMYLNNNGIYKINIDQPEQPNVWELALYTVAFALLWLLFLRFLQKRKMSTFVF